MSHAPLPEEPALRRVVAEAIATAPGRHPGIVTEAVVERLLAAYELTPREPWHRERRKNHGERVRRFAHEVYRILEDAGARAPDEIAARVARAFIVAPKGPASGGQP